MIGMTDAQSVALIGVGGTLMAAIVTGAVKFVVDSATRRVAERNTTEHLLNKEVLERIEEKVDDVRSSLTEHLSWHVANPQSKEHAA